MPCAAAKTIDALTGVDGLRLATTPTSGLASYPYSLATRLVENCHQECCHHQG